MKFNTFIGLDSLRRPIALMLTLMPAAALVVSFGIVHWTTRMTAYSHITNPELAMTIEGYAAFFRDYAIPVLVLSVGLAVVNLWCAFSVRPRERGVRSENGGATSEATAPVPPRAATSLLPTMSTAGR
jgi:hypothetical protein